MKKLSIVEIEYVAYCLAKELLDWQEPIPDFKSRFPHILESCLLSPFQTFSQKTMYKGLIAKAAILFLFND